MWLLNLTRRWVIFLFRGEYYPDLVTPYSVPLYPCPYCMFVGHTPLLCGCLVGHTLTCVPWLSCDNGHSSSHSSRIRVVGLDNFRDVMDCDVLYLQVGVYHGGEKLCEEQFTNDIAATCYPRWNQWLVFSIAVKNLPKVCDLYGEQGSIFFPKNYSQNKNSLYPLYFFQYYLFFFVLLSKSVLWSNNKQHYKQKHLGKFSIFALLLKEIYEFIAK